MLKKCNQISIETIAGHVELSQTLHSYGGSVTLEIKPEQIDLVIDWLEEAKIDLSFKGLTVDKDNEI